MRIEYEIGIKDSNIYITGDKIYYSPNFDDIYVAIELKNGRLVSYIAKKYIEIIMKRTYFNWLERLYMKIVLKTDPKPFISKTIKFGES